MKKNRFLILCLVTAMMIGVGAVQKNTALKDIRRSPLYLYTITYTVEVKDLEDYKVVALQEGVGLYLEDNTIMGIVEMVESASAASGAEGCCDLILTVSATGGKQVNSEPLEYDLTENNQMTFITRYLVFEGTVTHVKEVDA